MGQGIEKTKELLGKAKKERENLKEVLSADKEIIKQIDNLDVECSFLFPDANAALNEAKVNLSEIESLQKQISQIPLDAIQIKKDLLGFGASYDEAVRILEKAKILEKEAKYDEAIETINGFLTGPFTFDYGMNLSFQKTIALIYEWVYLRLFSLRAEQRIDNSQIPGTVEEIAPLLKRCGELDLDFGSEEKKKRLQDDFKGYYCLARAALEYSIPHDLHSLEELGKEENIIREGLNGLSGKASYRASILYDTLKREYVELSDRYFYGLREFDNVLKLYGMRTYIKEEDYPSFVKEAHDEKELRLLFDVYCNGLLDEEEFAKKSVELAAFAINGEGFDLAHKTFSSIGVNDVKAASLCQEVIKTSFSKAIAFFGASLEDGLTLSKQKIALEGLASIKKKVCDLEEAAPFLLTIKNKIDNSLEEEFGMLLSAILRSPKAHRIMRKTREESLIALAPFKRKTPIGRKPASNIVKSMEPTTLAFFWIVSCALPLLACVVMLVLFRFFFPNHNIGSILESIPLMLALLSYSFLVSSYFGRDERASSLHRNIIGVTSLLFGVAAFIYFLFPKQLTFLSPWAYGFFIYGFFSLVLGYFYFKPKRLAYNFIIYLPSLAVAIGSIVVMILRLRSGAISLS